jgi:ABC-type Mn2+/Zn2+ transport system permease subunit
MISRIWITVSVLAAVALLALTAAWATGPERTFSEVCIGVIVVAALAKGLQILARRSNHAPDGPPPST